MKWTEDKMAMVSAIVLILISIFAYLLPSLWSSDQNLFQDIQNESTINAPFKTIEEYEMETSKTVKPKENFLLQILEMTKVKTQTWEINPLGAFQSKLNEAKLAKYQTLQDQVATQLDAAKLVEQSAQNLLFQDKEANKKAEEAIAKWQKGLKEAKKEKPKPVVGTFTLIAGFLIGFLLLGIIFSFVLRFSTEGTNKFFVGFTFVFLIAMLAYVISSQAQLKDAGLGYALWSIALGIFIANFLSLPEWVKPGLKHELFIKTGLVLLGAEILFSKILAIGLPGIFVAWFVTPIVIVVTYWFGQNILKIGSKTLNITVSADMAVCGVSAAIATAAACNAKKEELTTAIGLSMIFTSIMMVIMPVFIKAVGMPEILGGAWIGGTIDATGAVVAAGSFLGEKALSVAATIKMIQNILIGVVAFFVAVYFTTKVDNQVGVKPSYSEIWKRFPKFILGFVGVSILYSIMYTSFAQVAAEGLIENGSLSFTGHIREFLFCLAFVSIGLSTDFKVLKSQFSGGKPLILYVVGQLFNLGLTLLVAWLVFYKIFPNITANI